MISIIFWGFWVNRLVSHALTTHHVYEASVPQFLHLPTLINHNQGTSQSIPKAISKYMFYIQCASICISSFKLGILEKSAFMQSGYKILYSVNIRLKKASIVISFNIFFIYIKVIIKAHIIKKKIRPVEF